jgi:hypothetical protein
MTDDGRWLTLLAAAGLAGVAAVRPRGSRGVVRGGRAYTDDALLGRLYDEIRALKDLQGHHGKSNRRSDPNNAYQFNIKAYHATPPESVREALGEERVAQEVDDSAQVELDQLLERLREPVAEGGLGMDWLDPDGERAGRSGGWWVLIDREKVLTLLEDVDNVWPGHEPEDVFAGGKKVGIRLNEDYRQEVKDALAKAVQRRKDLATIQRQINEEKSSWEEGVSSVDWWQDLLDAND